MTKRFFITGTDTDVGKTVFTVAFMSALRRAGCRVAGFKPVAAGGLVSTSDANKTLVKQGNEDALLIQSCSDFKQDYPSVNPILFSQPIAPHIASVNESVSMNADDCAAHIEQEVSRLGCGDEVDAVVIEGAGGWRVPLNNNQTIADIAGRLDAGVIIVVAIRLGCLNHALLTAEAIERDGLPLLGWIANCCEPDAQEIEENIATLQHRLGAPMLGRIPYLERTPQVKDTDLSKQFEALSEYIRPDLLSLLLNDE